MYHPDFLDVAYKLFCINPDDYKSLYKTGKGDHRKKMHFTGDLSSKFNDDNGKEDVKRVMEKLKQQKSIALKSVQFSGLPEEIEREAKRCFKNAIQSVLLLFSIKFCLVGDFIKYSKGETTSSIIKFREL